METDGLGGLGYGGFEVTDTQLVAIGTQGGCLTGVTNRLAVCESFEFMNAP